MDGLAVGVFTSSVMKLPVKNCAITSPKINKLRFNRRKILLDRRVGDDTISSRSCVLLAMSFLWLEDAYARSTGRHPVREPRLRIL